MNVSFIWYKNLSRSSFSFITQLVRLTVTDGQADRSWLIPPCIVCILRDLSNKELLYFTSIMMIKWWFDDDYYDYDYNHDKVNRFCNRECECLIGYIIVLLNISYALSAFTKCYQVKDQQYCFHTDGSVFSWNEAREFCTRRNSTLPIITDEDIDNMFQRFISDNNNQEVSGSDTEQMNNYVWLDAYARPVNDSVKWHWINGQPSG